MFDGETVFALALGPKEQAPSYSAQAAYQVSMIGAAAATTLARAVVKGVRHASDLHGIPATRN
jgi:L-aminopeptidase/D-esterase-like protein